jgi:hypothetical protein
MRITFSIAALVLLTACSQSRSPRINASRPLTAEETRVVEIARRAVATNDTWVESAEFQLPQQKPDGRWSVTVWRLPKEPGGFRDISIDTNGRVTDYYRGY